MCSAIQPSSRACTDAMRSAWHFLPSNALPPYPEPYDQISRVSGKWQMYLCSALQRQVVSWLVGAERGADRVQPANKVTIFSKSLQYLGANSGHEVHAGDHVRLSQ